MIAINIVNNSVIEAMPNSAAIDERIEIPSTSVAINVSNDPCTHENTFVNIYEL